MNVLRSSSFPLRRFGLPFNFRRPLSSSSDPVRSRFFAKKYQVELQKQLNLNCPTKSAVVEIISSIEHFVSENSSNLPNTESAIVLVPSLSLILPLISMKLQSQHLLFKDDLKQLETHRFDFDGKTYCPVPVSAEESIQPSLSNDQDAESVISRDGKDYLNFYILFFSPRATISNSILQSQVEEEEEEEDSNLSGSHAGNSSRSYSEERHRLLDEELRGLNIDPVLLSEKDFLGTPMVKIYRSFVYPKKNKNVIYNVKQAANRTAFQISLALRQYYTDLNSTFIRNTDKSKYLQKVQTFPVVLVLDNIRSAFNVGSMFRTAETSGVEEVITCGITPHPPHPKLKKTALNSTDNVPTRHFDDVISALEALKQEGYTIVSLETTKDSVKYTSITYPKKVAIVVGNEITGVDQRALNMSYKIAEIPTFGLKNSLNVASCAPIVLYEIIRQWDGQ